MKVLTLHQPHAQLCAIINPETGQPYKTIETRGWQPPRSLIGQQIALHASKRPPCSYRRETWVGNWKAHRRMGDGSYDLSLYQARSPELSPEPWRGLLDLIELPLGAIVATCTLVDVVPMVEPCTIGEHGPIGQRVLQVDGIALDLIDRWPHGGQVLAHHDDQRPYGLFDPGRYAWLLADVVPVDPPVPFRGGQGLTKEWEQS